QVAVRLAQLLRRLVPGARSEPRDDEARPRGANGRGLVPLREEVPGRDERARREARTRPPRGSLARDELLRRLLLRGREPLPPVDPAEAARRSRRRRPALENPALS